MSSRLLAAGLAAVIALPAAAADQAAVDVAVQKGVNYLKQVHAPKSGYSGGNADYGLGTAALGGLALIEGGVPRNDPALENVAQYVRTQALTENRTYRVALALIFLDRYGDKRDVPLIQVLGVRLYHGMNPNAGWSYTTFPDVPPAEAARLAAVLSEPAPAGKLHPEAARTYQAVRLRAASLGRTMMGSDDNSNTQFGLIGLWVASRHQVPVNDAIAALELRFLRSQNLTDGGWGYRTGEPHSTASMTCAGLLALAAGAARRESEKTGKPLAGDTPAPQEAQPDPEKEKPAPADAFANPRKRAAVPVDPGKAVEPPPPEPEPVPEADPKKRGAAIEAGLAAIGRVIAATPFQPGPTSANGGPLNGFVGHGNFYYLLWSIERVGVIFGLETIGDVNWFDWGAEYLLNAQAADGSWGGGQQYGATVNTPFAILFLCKANLVAEITGRVKGKHKDPGRAELRGGGPPPLAAPSRPEPAAPPPPPEPKIAETAVLPDVQDTSEIVRRAGMLTAATDEQWPDRLVELRDSKGAMNTLALARAITTMDGIRRKQARDTLADRLVRMTPDTLRGLLQDEDPEVRRATALACAMKEDQSHVPDLIGRLTDPSDLVVRAARAALRSLTEKDFGPEPGATEAGKAKAAEDWRRWYDTRRPQAE